MPTFWSKLILRNRNYGMQDNLGKSQSSKKKKKSKKSTSMSNLNSSQDTNFYENDTSDEYLYGDRDSPRTRNSTFDYEDVSGLLMPIDNRPVMSDFHNNNNSNAGGMAHYMPKATQHLFLSRVLEGEKLDDYFHDCRLDNALKNFARFDSYEQPILRAPDSPCGKENLYETIEPDIPPTPEPVHTDRKGNKNSHKLDIRNWPTMPLVSGSGNNGGVSNGKQHAVVTTTVDSAGEEQEEDDNYIHFEAEVTSRSPVHSNSRSSYVDDSFDDLPWCSGVDVLY